MIVEGFFEPLLAELQDEPLEELVRAKVAAKLARASEDIESMRRPVKLIISRVGLVAARCGAWR